MAAKYERLWGRELLRIASEATRGQSMRLRAKVVKGFGYGWLTLAGNGILLGLAWIKPSFFLG